MEYPRRGAGVAGDRLGASKREWSECAVVVDVEHVGRFDDGDERRDNHWS